MNDTGAETLPNFPLRRSHPDAVPDDYRSIREHGIGRARLPTGRTVWVVAGYRDTRAVLADRRFSADKTRPDFPSLSARARDKLKHFAGFLPNLDGADHARVKKALVGDFTAAAVERLRPRVQQAVDEAVEDILRTPRRPVDLVPALSFASAFRLQEILLGFRYDDLATIREYSDDFLLRSSGPAEEEAAAAKLHEHIETLLTWKERHPGDDLISRLIGRGVDRFELASILQLLAVGDYNSVAAMVSLGVLALLRHPADTAVLLREPGRMAGAVHEILRFYAVSDAAPCRVATADVQLGETLIRAGDGVALPLVLANRDGGTCPHADELRLLRDQPRHIAFGHGPHLCLGYLLAPMHLEIVYRTLFTRIPSLRLAADEKDLTFAYHSPQAVGLVELPVTW